MIMRNENKGGKRNIVNHKEGEYYRAKPGRMSLKLSIILFVILLTSSKISIK